MSNINEVVKSDSKSKITISKQSAADQMKIFLDFYDIDQNDIVIEQGPEAIETILNRLIRAISTGNIEIQDNGAKVVQHLKKPIGELSTITYGELSATNKMAMDGLAANKNNAKVLALMGSLAGVPGSALMNIKGVDLSIMERLFTLFMVV